MPQVSQIDLKQGNIVDPTFGLQALARESERKTKENRQMEAVANTLRKQLELKKLSKGTTVTVNQGGGIEWTGEHAARDEANFNNWGENNYGRKGAGNSVTSKEISDGSVAARERAIQFTGANKGQVDVVTNKVAQLAANGLPASTTTLPPLPQPPGTTNPTTTGTVTPALHPFISAPAQTNPVPLAPIPSTIAAPPPAINVPYSGTTAVAQKVAQAAAQPQNFSSSVSAGESYAIGGSVNSPDYAETGHNMNLETTVNDTNVTDYLRLDQTDLAVAQAMQDIYAQINGVNSPKSYDGMMKMNEDTIAASRAAELASGTSTKEVPGRSWSINMRGANASFNESRSKDQRASSSGGSNQNQPKAAMLIDRNGSSLTGTRVSDSESSFPNGGHAMFANINRLATISDGAFSEDKGKFVLKSGGGDRILNALAADNGVNGNPDNTHTVVKAKNGKSYLSIKNKAGQEIMWQDVDATEPIYVDDMNQVHANKGINSNGTAWKSMPKITTHMGSYTPQKGSTTLNTRDIDGYVGQSVTYK